MKGEAMEEAKKHDLKPGDRVLVTGVCGDDTWMQLTCDLITLDQAAEELCDWPGCAVGYHFFARKDFDDRPHTTHGIYARAILDEGEEPVLFFLEPYGKRPSLFEIDGDLGYYGVFLVERIVKPIDVKRFVEETIIPRALEEWDIVMEIEDEWPGGILTRSWRKDDEDVKPWQTTFSVSKKSPDLVTVANVSSGVDVTPDAGIILHLINLL